MQTSVRIQNVLSQQAQKQAVKPINTANVLQIYTVQKEPADFIYMFSENELHLRHVSEQAQLMELINQNAQINTPVATRDFVIRFYNKDGSKTTIKQVIVSKSGSKAETILILTSNGIDSCLFRIPLKYFVLTLAQNGKLQQFSFAVKGNDIATICRNFDKYPKLGQFGSINSDLIVGYEMDSQSLVLINYSDVNGGLTRYKHEVQTFSLVQQPSNILVDTRGLMHKMNQITEVLPNKSGIYMILDRLACVDLFEYYLNNRNIDIREVQQPGFQIQSKYSYLRQLYPLHLIPKGFKPELQKLISASAAVTIPKTSKSPEQFFILTCMAWRNDIEKDNQPRFTQQYQTNSQFITGVPDEVFVKHNIFLYSQKKLVAYAAVNYYPDILQVSQDQRYIFVASSKSFMTNIFKIEEQNGKISLVQEKPVQHPHQVTQLTSVCSTLSGWLLMFDNKNSVYTYKGDLKQYSCVSNKCQNNFGELNLPVKPLRLSPQKQVTFADQLNVNDLNTNTDEQVRRLTETKIPGIQGFMTSSLFSPINETFIRRAHKQPQLEQTSTKLANDLIELAIDLGEEAPSNDLKEFQEIFVQYFRIYEQLRLIEEFVALILNPNIEEENIQHLDIEMRDLLLNHLQDCAITIRNSRHVLGNPEFYFSELKYVNNIIFQILQPHEKDLQLNFQLLHVVRSVMKRDAVDSTFLQELHKLLENSINTIEITNSDVCKIIMTEYQEEIKKQGKLIPIVQIVAQKTQQMTEYFQTCCSYKTQVLSALHYQTVKNQERLNQLNESSISYSFLGTKPQTLQQHTKLIDSKIQEQDKAIDQLVDSPDIRNFDKIPENLEKELKANMYANKKQKIYEKPNMFKVGSPIAQNTQITEQQNSDLQSFEEMDELDDMSLRAPAVELQNDAKTVSMLKTQETTNKQVIKDQAIQKSDLITEQSKVNKSQPQQQVNSINEYTYEEIQEYEEIDEANEANKDSVVEKASEIVKAPIVEVVDKKVVNNVLDSQFIAPMIMSIDPSKQINQQSINETQAQVQKETLGEGKQKNSKHVKQTDEAKDYTYDYENQYYYEEYDDEEMNPDALEIDIEKSQAKSAVETEEQRLEKLKQFEKEQALQQSILLKTQQDEQEKIAQAAKSQDLSKSTKPEEEKLTKEQIKLQQKKQKEEELRKEKEEKEKQRKEKELKKQKEIEEKEAQRLQLIKDKEAEKQKAKELKLQKEAELKKEQQDKLNKSKPPKPEPKLDSTNTVKTTNPEPEKQPKTTELENTTSQPIEIEKPSNPEQSVSKPISDPNQAFIANSETQPQVTIVHDSEQISSAIPVDQLATSQYGSLAGYNNIVDTQEQLEKEKLIQRMKEQEQIKLKAKQKAQEQNILLKDKTLAFTETKQEIAEPTELTNIEQSLTKTDLKTTGIQGIQYNMSTSIINKDKMMQSALEDQDELIKTFESMIKTRIQLQQSLNQSGNGNGAKFSKDFSNIKHFPKSNLASMISTKIEKSYMHNSLLNSKLRASQNE
ncbi:Conserved_hypothetical protein [Hexamita inflata]|uniref:Uncharacterized protein n=1 Tax=Hexamita inflata TaxID=28002 RepID=A0AA86UGT9_9EUKA|nr:Conserved hypothetical protein [Hexamita inflata]